MFRAAGPGRSPGRNGRGPVGRVASVVALLVAGAAPAWSADPGFRDRATIRAYELLATRAPRRATAKAYRVLAGGAPRLLYDLELQRLFWTASGPGGGRDASAVKKARAEVARRGLKDALRDPKLRRAFRYFFGDAGMRQRLSPLVRSAKDAAAPLAARAAAGACLDHLRLLNAAASLFEAEAQRPAGASAAEVVAALGRAGYRSGLPACAMDFASCAYSPSAGFDCPGIGSSLKPAPLPPLDRAGLAAAARDNAYLAAMLELTPADAAPSAGSPPLDVYVRRTSSLAYAQPEAALAAATAAREALPAQAGAVGTSVRLREIEWLRRLRRFPAARARLAELESWAAAAGDAAGDTPAMAAVLRARVELGAGDWPAATRALDRAEAAVKARHPEPGVRRVGVLQYRATVAKLRGDHAAASAALRQAIAALEDAGMAGGTAGYELVLGRSEASAGKLPAAQAALGAVIRGLGAPGDPLGVYRLAAAHYLRGLTYQMAGDGARASADFSVAVAGALATPVTTPALEGIEPEAVAGLGSLARLQRRYPEARAFLDRAKAAALEEGGPAHPVLGNIDAELAQLAGEVKRQAESEKAMHARIDAINKRIAAKDYAAAAADAAAAKADLAKMGGDPELLGWLRFFQFQAKYLGGGYAEAYALLTAPEPHAFEIPPANAGYMASVAVELATRLGKPADEVVRWGAACYDARLRSGDPEAAALCARNAHAMFRLRDEEPRSAPFAEKLIELGRQRKDPDLVFEATEMLGEGARRAGRRGELPAILQRMDTVLSKIPLTADQRARRKKLFAVLMAPGDPPSRAGELAAWKKGIGGGS